MTHKQWFNNVLHLHPVHEEGAIKGRVSPGHFQTDSNFGIKSLQTYYGCTSIFFIWKPIAQTFITLQKYPLHQITKAFQNYPQGICVSRACDRAR